MFYEKNTIFGQVVEGLDTIMSINDAYCDTQNRPYQNIRIRHTVILDDPFDDPPTMVVPEQSPPPARDANRLEDDEVVDENEGKTQEEIEQELKAKEAKSRAVVLEMV